MAIVTGAGAGIGRAIALHFAQNGAAVAIADMDPEGLAETEGFLREGGARVLPILADVEIVADTERIAAETMANSARFTFS